MFSLWIYSLNLAMPVFCTACMYTKSSYDEGLILGGHYNNKRLRKELLLDVFLSGIIHNPVINAFKNSFLMEHISAISILWRLQYFSTASMAAHLLSLFWNRKNRFLRHCCFEHSNTPPSLQFCFSFDSFKKRRIAPALFLPQTCRHAEQTALHASVLCNLDIRSTPPQLLLPSCSK